jgi:hypothetical protein
MIATPRAHDREVAADRALEQVLAAVGRARLFAFGDERADAGRRVEGGDAGAARADASSIVDALPAVTVPSLANTGRSVFILREEGRSRANRTGGPRSNTRASACARGWVERRSLEPDREPRFHPRATARRTKLRTPVFAKAESKTEVGHIESGVHV